MLGDLHVRGLLKNVFLTLGNALFVLDLTEKGGIMAPTVTIDQYLWHILTQSEPLLHHFPVLYICLGFMLYTLSLSSRMYRATGSQLSKHLPPYPRNADNLLCPARIPPLEGPQVMTPSLQLARHRLARRPPLGVVQPSKRLPPRPRPRGSHPRRSSPPPPA